MNRRTATVLLGGAAVLTVAVLLLISLVLQRTSVRSTTRPTSPVSSPESSPVAGVTSETESPPGVDSEGGAPAPDPTFSGGADASPSGVRYSQTAEARRQWQPVVVGFGTGFTRTTGRSATAWRAGLDPYVTTAVQKQLRTVDPRNVPGGRYAGFEVDTYEEETVAAMVTYREGWALVLYLVHDGEKWRIYRYDRWEE